MSRVIIFTARMQEMVRFYSQVLGLEKVTEEANWVEFSADGVGIALHAWTGRAPEGPIKIVFYSGDLEDSRSKLRARGAELGDIVRFGSIELCDGKDPDGNAFQLSSRPALRSLC